jgi:prepilin-type processing-associated H-X9-DG protein
MASRQRAAGFTLVELLVVISMVFLLVAMLLPSLSSAKRQAGVASCSFQVRALLTGLSQYASDTQDLLPPIGFASLPGNIPLSGHWGGYSQDRDPTRWYANHFDDVNLWALLRGGYVTPGHLLCGGCDSSLRKGNAGYFPFSGKFSTYCLRSPYSADLFSSSPNLMNYSRGDLMFAYCAASSGVSVSGGRGDGWDTLDTVLPYARFSRDYVEAHPVGGTQRKLNYTQSPILSDGFWLESFRKRKPPPPEGGYSLEVKGSWSHADRFNVGYGDGRVRTVRDKDKLIWKNSTHDQPPPDDGHMYASYAMNVWRFFEE